MRTHNQKKKKQPQPKKVFFFWGGAGGGVFIYDLGLDILVGLILIFVFGFD